MLLLFETPSSFSVSNPYSYFPQRVLYSYNTKNLCHHKCSHKWNIIKWLTNHVKSRNIKLIFRNFVYYVMFCFFSGSPLENSDKVISLYISWVEYASLRHQLTFIVYFRWESSLWTLFCYICLIFSSYIIMKNFVIRELYIFVMSYHQFSNSLQEIKFINKIRKSDSAPFQLNKREFISHPYYTLGVLSTHLIYF